MPDGDTPATHNWVSMQYTPLIVEKDDTGTLKVFASEAQIEASIDEAKMGCWFCHTPLTAESYDTYCPAGNV